MILICIKDGVVIAAGTVVCTDIGPYEIWGGVPAKFIKYRVKKEWIERLLELAWWNWPLNVIERNNKGANRIFRGFSWEKLLDNMIGGI